ncbi:MAG: GNAT family N-acetyltransferase [Terracidiphilus sp.]
MKLDRIEIRIVENYSAQDRLSLAGGDCDPAQTASYHLQWQSKAQHVLILENGIAVSHAGLVKQIVVVDGRFVAVAGIGGVLTRPDCRGRGFGQIVMQKAEEFAERSLMTNFGLLFCRTELCAWYERLGWVQVFEPVWIDQPEGSIRAPLVVMTKGFGEKRWPSGEVQLGCFPW